MSFSLEKVSIKDDFISVIIQIIIFSSYVINFYSTELSYCSEAAVYDGLCSNCLRRSLFDPSYEYFSCSERILRHRAYRLSCRSEVLRKSLLFISVIVKYHESDLILIFQLSCYSKVGINGLSAGVLSLTYEPSIKILTFYSRSARKLDRIALVVFVSLICLSVDFICNGEYVLVIFCPDTEFSIAVRFQIDVNVIPEVSFTVYPFA